MYAQQGDRENKRDRRYETRERQFLSMCVREIHIQRERECVCVFMRVRVKKSAARKSKKQNHREKYIPYIFECSAIGARTSQQ